MSNDATVLSEMTVDQARELVKCMEQGDQDRASRLLDEITKLREDSLFRELGKLTREFHETLNSFRLDSRISNLAEKDIPDARERLKYVITMTEQAADRTLNAVEQSVPVCDGLEEGAGRLKSEWERFTRREMGADEFRNLSQDLGAFLALVAGDVPKLRSNFQDVLMAQDFQDLTGQIIRRVITLVEDLEGSMVDLIRISGAKLVPDAKATRDEERGNDIEATGPAVPGVDNADTVSGQDEVDDLLSSLGF